VAAIEIAAKAAAFDAERKIVIGEIFAERAVVRGVRASQNGEMHIGVVHDRARASHLPFPITGAAQIPVAEMRTGKRGVVVTCMALRMDARAERELTLARNPFDVGVG